jgi:hypothetical protein
LNCKPPLNIHAEEICDNANRKQCGEIPHEVESIIPFTQSLVQDFVCEALNTRGQSEQMLGQERLISQFPQPQMIGRIG